MDSDKVRVVIKLANNENFTEGESMYQVAIIWFHNIISQPDWWTSTVTSYYLGTYSDLKYSLFNSIVGVDLTDADESTIRHYASYSNNTWKNKKQQATPYLKQTKQR